jgi:RNA polymerase sigma-70 factor (ECF subfamily)
MAGSSETAAVLGSRSPLEQQVDDTLERGDRKAALALLMEGCGGAIRRLCADLLGDPVQADDVAQLTFVQAFDALNGLRRQSSYRAWLMGIARHRCLDAIKSRRRWTRIFVIDGADADVADAPVDLESHLAADAVARAIAACLRILPEAMRVAVVLRYRQGLSYRDISSEVGAREGAVRVRVARALPKLQRCLREKGIEP